jgi:hypothetical protein
MEVSDKLDLVNFIYAVRKAGISQSCRAAGFSKPDAYYNIIRGRSSDPVKYTKIFQAALNIIASNDDHGE